MTRRVSTWRRSLLTTVLTLAMSALILVNAAALLRVHVHFE